MGDSRTTKPLFACLLALCCASPLAAQRQEVTLEASVVRGALGYARVVRPRLLAGVEVGFGFPQIDRTLAPRQDEQGSPDFEEFLHVGVFLRMAPSPNLDVDVGVRGSIGDLWECGASDCWPAPFLGAYVQPMAGWRRLKFGPRLTVGWMFETEPGTNREITDVVSLNPFIARFTLPW